MPLLFRKIKCKQVLYQLQIYRLPGYQCIKKGVRFMRFCDVFNISLVTLFDASKFLPGSFIFRFILSLSLDFLLISSGSTLVTFSGTRQEHDSSIRHGAKLIYAYARTTIIKATVSRKKVTFCAHNSRIRT